MLCFALSSVPSYNPSNTTCCSLPNQIIRPDPLLPPKKKQLEPFSYSGQEFVIWLWFEISYDIHTKKYCIQMISIGYSVSLISWYIFQFLNFLSLFGCIKHAVASLTVMSWPCLHVLFNWGIFTNYMSTNRLKWKIFNVQLKIQNYSNRNPN
jgi:hypothetical protein